MVIFNSQQILDRDLSIISTWSWFLLTLLRTFRPSVSRICAQRCHAEYISKFHYPRMSQWQYHRHFSFLPRGSRCTLPCRMLSSDRHLCPADAKGNLDTLLSPHNKIRFHSMLKPFGSCMLHPLQSVRAHGDRALRTCQWPLFGSPGFLPGPSPTETDIITVSLYLFLAAVQAPSHQLVLYASSSSLPDSGAIQDPEWKLNWLPNNDLLEASRIVSHNWINYFD